MMVGAGTRIPRSHEGGGREPPEEDEMKKITWARRICIGSGLALTSVLSVPAMASAATPSANCYTGCTPPTVDNNTVVPPTTSPSSSGAGSTSPSATLTVSGSSSLPFTGADVGELAAVGVGAIVVGGVLARRRRRTA